MTTPASDFSREAHYRSLALTEPRMTALSDHPVVPEEGWIDRFNFPSQLGTIYDIIRHPDTQTPLTVGIYGDWGTGKTSGMKWLEGMLNIWNAEGEGINKKRILPVWFYPWKYHNREDVWRGIVAEIVLATMGFESASPERVLFAVKRFGAFLGKSFVRALASIKLKAKDPTGQLPEGEVTFQAVEKILEDFQELNHPERAYLNRFESMLENWIKNSLSGDERLVLFVDDLDRCLPDVTLEVLEAMKLYLNIPELVFVVGLDKRVVESVVREHYGKRGVDPEKAGAYLAKMFQIEVHLFRMQQAVDEFIDDQLNRFDIWNDEISDDEKPAFKSAFSRHAGDSPREVKRVINAAMIASQGWTTFEMGDGKKRLSFSEGMQRHFIRLRLAELDREKVLASAEGNRFLAAWSQCIADGKGRHHVQEGVSDSDTKHLLEVCNAYPDYSVLVKDYNLGELLAVNMFRASCEIVLPEISSFDFLPKRRFRVALSFPGEKRDRVEVIADLLGMILGRENVLYDRWHQAELARPDLDTYLHNLYLNEVDLVVVFIAPQYEDRKWCGLEDRALRRLIIEHSKSDIMIIAYEHADFQSVLYGDGYIDATNQSPADIANLILDRLRMGQRRNR
jgi:hypothetical protein